MKTIRLTEQELEMIKNALKYVYDCKIGNLNQNNKIYSKEEVENITKSADKYFDLSEEITEQLKQNDKIIAI